MGRNDGRLQHKEEQVQAIIDNLVQKNPEAIKTFFKIFSNDIYNYPIRYYNFSDDEAGDFYLYAFEHLNNGKKFSSFKNKSKFTTWFFSVLRNLVIDFLRSRKNKLKTTSFIKSDANGNIINALDFIPETDETVTIEESVSKTFQKAIEELKIYHRVLFKLAYIHFMELSDEEFKWLCEENRASHPEMVRKIAELKETGRKKANEVRNIEDKLTSNFQAILVIENKLRLFFADHPTIDNDVESWNEEYENPDIPQEVILLIRSLVKKKNRQFSLLKTQKKSLGTTRIPYKDFAPLLNSSEGVLSVQLLRVIDKISGNIEW